MTMTVMQEVWFLKCCHCCSCPS